MAKTKTVKKYLKLKRPHQTGFRLGKHLITMGAAKEFKLDDKEVKELKGKGPQHWIKEISKKEMEAKPKSNSENKEMQDLKKELVELGVELKGDESIEELKSVKDEAMMMKELIKICKEKEIELTGEETVEELEALIG